MLSKVSTLKQNVLKWSKLWASFFYEKLKPQVSRGIFSQAQLSKQ